MIDFNFHNTKKFTLGEITEIENSSTGLPFFTRKVYIENNEGQTISFTLFADKKEVLQIEVTTKKLV